MSSEEALRLIEAEYREMPGLSLTLAQAGRLWMLDPMTCEAVFARLVRQGVLHQTRHGRFIALPTPRNAQLKAALSAAHHLRAQS
jgi:hypothetical protein